MKPESGSLIGAVIGGIYKVRRFIGAGGMGEVYAAEGKHGEKVAIKVLHDRAAQDPDLVARFQREASIAAQVKSPYVAGIVGAGKDRNGRLWIAFERLNGEGLDARLRREHYLSFAEVAPILDDALQGLEAAHKAGVIHRDIKPANLFIEKRKLTAKQTAAHESEERTRILDFGVSKMRSRAGRKSEPSLTAFDATLGSFAYMAPEQVRGSARVDERADLYAMGAVAFRALTGRLPFEGQNAMTLIALKLDREPPSLAAATGDEWPGVIERYLERMMARDKEKRFGGALEAFEQWRKVCRTMGNAPAPPTPKQPAPSSYPVVDDRTEVTEASISSVSSVGSSRLGRGWRRRVRGSIVAAHKPRERRRGGLVAILFGLVALGLLGGGVVLALVLPGWVRERAVAEAARQGVVLEVRDVALGFPRLRLLGVTARLRDVPQLTVTADEAEVGLSPALAPSEVHLPRARVALVGSLAEVVASVERASPPPSDGAVAFTLAGDATWRGVLGAGTDATGKVTATARGAQFEAKVADVRLAAAGKTLGPWSAEVAWGAASRIALLLDAKGAARVDLSRAAGATRFALKVPRVGPASIGVPPELLGLAGGRGEVQADVSGAIEGGTRFDGAAAVRAYGVSLGVAPLPVDVAFDAAVKGDARGPMSVSRGNVTIGPLRADVTGIVELLAPFGVRADLTWQAGPTPCPFLPGPSLFRGGARFHTRPAGAVGAGGAAWSFRVDAASVCGVSLLGR